MDRLPPATNLEEPPFHRKWRPAMAWSYMMICLFDFILNPIFFSLLHHGQVIQWQPLTLMGGGLYHVSMLAILGVTAYGRTKEKISFAEFATKNGLSAVTKDDE